MLGLLTELFLGLAVLFFELVLLGCDGIIVGALFAQLLDLLLNFLGLLCLEGETVGLLLLQEQSLLFFLAFASLLSQRLATLGKVCL